MAIKIGLMFKKRSYFHRISLFDDFSVLYRKKGVLNGAG